MDVIYWLIPLSIAILSGAVVLLFWAVRSGQFQDLDSPAVEILFDNDDSLVNIEDEDCTSKPNTNTGKAGATIQIKGCMKK